MPYKPKAQEGGRGSKGKHAGDSWTQPLVLSQLLDIFRRGCGRGLLESGQHRNSGQGFFWQAPQDFLHGKL